MTFSSNFGGTPDTAPGKENWQRRILILTVLLSGSVMFMSYQASITSELSTRLIKLPFDSPSSMLETDYQ
jgi:hypothetical protein